MNDTLSPLVSIIICVYNGEKYLERCLQSAMSQSYKNIEIIVVNDGSMDNTPVIIENYVKLDCRIIACYKQTEWRNIRSEKNRCESGTGEIYTVFGL